MRAFSGGGGRRGRSVRRADRLIAGAEPVPAGLAGYTPRKAGLGSLPWPLGVIRGFTVIRISEKYGVAEQPLRRLIQTGAAFMTPGPAPMVVTRLALTEALCCNGQVQFEHDNMVGVHLAVALVNLDSTGSWTPEAMEQVLREHQIRRPRVTDSSREEIRAWSRRMRLVFEASSQTDRCQNINALLSDGAGSVYLTTHDSLRPHLHFAPDGQDLQSRVKAVTAGGLAIFTLEAEGERLGVCARGLCQTAFVDTSRNGRRAYCSARCANTDAVRRHRGKQH